MGRTCPYCGAATRRDTLGRATTTHLRVCKLMHLLHMIDMNVELMTDFPVARVELAKIAYRDRRRR